MPYGARSSAAPRRRRNARTKLWCCALGVFAWSLGAQGCDSDADSGSGGTTTTSGTGGQGGSSGSGGGGDEGGAGGLGGSGGAGGSEGGGGAAPAHTDLLYVASEAEIWTYVIGADGSVTPGPTIAEGGDKLVADVADRRLYSSLKYQTNQVRAFDIAEDGSLTLVNDSYLSGSQTTGLALDAANDRVVVGHTTNYAVRAYPIGGDGSIGSGATAATPAGLPGWVALHPSGNWVLAPVLPTMGDNLVEVFAYDGTTGNLTSVGSDTASLNHVRVAIPESQPWVHTADGIDSSVTTFSFNATGGQLAVLSTESTIPPGYTGSNTATTLAISVDDSTVYVLNHGHDSVATFSVGPGGGLTALGNTPTGDEPADLELSPDGGYLYVLAKAQNGQRLLGVFRIETGGTLTHLADVTLYASLGAQDIAAVRLDPT